MTAYAKNIIRTIGGNLRRYLVMTLITALGVAFFVGLRSTSPDMNYTLDRYFDEHGMYDLRFLTSLGVTENQIATIRGMPGVGSALPAYYCDMFVAVGDGAVLARLHSLDISAAGGGSLMNMPALLEGRLPENAGECLFEERSLAVRGGKIGDVITVSTGDGEDLADTLARDTFTIVGTVQSPVYISPVLGNSGKGSGRLDAFVYIPAENFALEVYTEAYIRFSDSAGRSRFSAGYEDLRDPLKKELEQTGKQMAAERERDIQKEGGEKIADGKQEITDARKKISDAERDIKDGEQKLTDGEQELKEKTADFYREIADAEEELRDGREKLEDAEREVADAKEELEQGKSDLDKLRSGLREIAKNLDVSGFGDIPGALADAISELEDGKAELKSAKRELDKNEKLLLESEKQLAGGLAQAREGLAAIEAACGNDPVVYQNVPEWRQLAQKIAYLEAQQAQIEPGKAQIAQGRADWEEGDRELKRQNRKLENMAREFEVEDIVDLPDKLQELIDEIPGAVRDIADGEREIADAEEEIRDKWLEYEDGVRELEEGRAEGLEKIADAKQKILDAQAELDDGKQKLGDAKREADEKLPDAERDIADAEKKLADMPEPKSYVLTLDSNIGFASFKQDSERIQAISYFFPLIFFLVAALVSFTSMMRVVENDRPTVGALKSLGYGPIRIMWKYIFYALAVCVPGCLLGVAAGYRLLPAAIFNQGYKILYLMPALDTPLQPEFCVTAFLISVVSVLTPTIAVCRSELFEQPAALLRPKAPRAGRRIILERIPFIWGRLNFSAKVCARNILRYKKRFLMTVTGVIGCVAIVLTGFGLRDSIGAIASRQYGKVFLYDFDISLGDTADNEKQEFLGWLSDYGPVSSYAACRKDGVDVKTSGNGLEVTLVVPSDPAGFGEFVCLSDPTTNLPLDIPENGVLITQKLGKLLGVGAGGSITFTDSDDAVHTLPVAGVTENYVVHYIYCSPGFYREMFGLDAGFNQILCRAGKPDEDARDAISTEILKQDAVNGVSFVAKMKEYYTDAIDSLNVVVLILLIAGALLSFIVLFCLTGINIDERERELATLKVLGFYDRETANYIFRENIVSTAIGTAAGLFAGVFLHRLVMDTAEIDAVMFGRDIATLSFVFTAALSFVFLAVVNRVMSRRIRKIDMIESLKSVE